MDDLKLLIQILQGLGKLVKDIRELADSGSEEDKISQKLADDHARIIQKLETLGKRGEQQKDGGEVRDELITGAKTLEEAARDPNLPLDQKNDLLAQATRLRDKAALLDAGRLYNFSDLLSLEEFKNLKQLIEKGKDAVEDRKALKEVLNTVVALAVLAAKVAAKL